VRYDLRDLSRPPQTVAELPAEEVIDALAVSEAAGVAVASTGEWVGEYHWNSRLVLVHLDGGKVGSLCPGDDVDIWPR